MREVCYAARENGKSEENNEWNQLPWRRFVVRNSSFTPDQQQPARQAAEISGTFIVKMFLLFSRTLLEVLLSIVEIGKRRLFVDIPPGRFGSSRPSLREGIVLE